MDILYNIFVFPVYIFCEVVFENIYMLTGKNIFNSIFIFAFLGNVFFIPNLFKVLTYSAERTKNYSKYLISYIYVIFLFSVVLYLQNNLTFFDLDFIENNLISKFLNSFFILCVGASIFAFCGSFKLFSQNIFKLKSFSTLFLSFIVPIIVAFSSFVVSFESQIFLFLNFLFYYLYVQIFTKQNSEKIYKKFNIVVGIIAVFPSFCYLLQIQNWKFLLLFLGVVYTLYFVKKKSMSVCYEFNPDIGLLLMTLVFLFIWYGVYITSIFIGASPSEFSFIGYINNPLSIVFNTSEQAFGFFIFYPLLFYYSLSSKPWKNMITFFSVLVVFFSVFNFYYFLVNSNLSTLSVDLSMDLSKLSILMPWNIFWNTCLLLLIFLILLLLYKKQTLLRTVICILIFSTFFSICTNIINIFEEYRKLNTNDLLKTNSKIQKVINLSKTGKNIIIIFLDRAIGAYIPMIFDNDSKIKEKYSGFVYYPNTVTFYPHTILGYPPVIAGYEYTPDKLDKRKGLMKDKYNEALLMLPLLFKNNGFQVSVVEPPLENFEWRIKDGKIFEKYKISHYVLNINTDNLYDKNIITGKIKRNFILFNIFSSAPSCLKKLIYSDGNYKKLYNKDNDVLYDEYIAAESIKISNLEKLSNIYSENVNTFTIFNSGVMHINNYKGPNSEAHYKMQEYAFTQIADYLDFMRKNNVYDNTRIIIVSDHGRYGQPNSYISENLTQYNPVLMVKDFNSKLDFKNIDTFMTNADTVEFAIVNVIKNPVNPFTNNHILKYSNKSNLIIFSGDVDSPLAFKNEKCLKNGINRIIVDKDFLTKK